MPKAEYRLSPKARNDMESVWLYTLSQWGHEQTEKYIDDLATAFELSNRQAQAWEELRQYPARIQKASDFASRHLLPRS
jgi:plasmid stabilization system protein ParE